MTNRLSKVLDTTIRVLQAVQRQSGKTTTLITTTPLNSIIVCMPHTKGHMERKVQELGRDDLKVIACSPDWTMVMDQLRGSTKRVFFDHFWEEELFKQIISDTQRNLTFFEEGQFNGK